MPLLERIIFHGGSTKRVVEMAGEVHPLPGVELEQTADRPPRTVDKGRAIKTDIERSENIASSRIAPDSKSFMLAGRTFDLVCHDAKPRACGTRKSSGSRLEQCGAGRVRRFGALSPPLVPSALPRGRANTHAGLLLRPRIGGAA
jgi:hypothetical protein